MFHRPKNEDKTAPSASTAKPVNLKIAQPASPLAATEKPIALDLTKTGTQSRINSKPISTLPEEKIMADEQQSKPLSTPQTNQQSSQQSAQQSASSSRPLDIPGSSSYQPQPARSGAGYSAPNTYATAPSAGPGHNKAPQGRKLVIGEGISLSGEIEACEYLVIEGTVEAALKGASVLQIAESGTFYGTVEIDEATVSGRFEGEMTVNGRLTITATGSVTGTITYKELAVEAGATLDGKINPLSGSKVATGKKSERAGKPKTAASRNDNSVDGIELPFNGNTAAVG